MCIRDRSHTVSSLSVGETLNVDILDPTDRTVGREVFVFLLTFVISIIGQLVSALLNAEAVAGVLDDYQYCGQTGDQVDAERATQSCR